MKKRLSLLLTASLVLLLAACGGQSAGISNESAQQSTSILPLAAAAEPEALPFTDIAADADYAQAAAWCFEQGLMAGVGGNCFDPEGTLTRAMLSTILYRAAGTPVVTDELRFTDAQAGTWYSDAVVWADKQGYMKGYGKGLFGTNDPVSVEQLEIVLGRYIGNRPEWTGDPAKAHAATRAQVAVALYEALKDAPAGGGKVLVAYFSATGNTKAVAGYIASQMNADTYEIVPDQPYTDADLNYNDDSSRVCREHEDPSLRPAMAGELPDLTGYDTVFLGYPLWWGEAPHVVLTFLDSVDLTGKTVVPFCTSASSPLGSSDTNLHDDAPNANWLPGQRFRSSVSESDVTAWVDTLDLPKPSTNTAATKTLVAYFSRTGENYGVGVIEKGNTEIVAEMIADKTGADLFEIETVKTYPSGYEDTKTIAQQEQAENARPELKATVDNFGDYDVIFVGYPIWYSDAPMAVYTFLESYDFTGKTVVPFCTHAGSGLSGTVNSIKSALPGATVLDGLAISGTTAQNDRTAAQSSVDTFLDGLDILRSSNAPAVYMTTSISPEGLMEVYDALNWTPTGKVAVKLSTGEPPASNYLRPELIKNVVQAVDGTIVECNTAYGGQRPSTAMHYQVAEDHGFTDIAAVKILDEDGSMSLPVEGGSVLTENYVGAAFDDYDSYLVLSHFKGHAMAGYGGAIKNISIGLGSSEGKCWIHSGGTSRTSPWGGDQDAFLESMAEAGKSVSDYLGNGEKIVYVNVMNRLSVDCDCDGNPAEPDMHDIGILASTDPVALDQACIDLIYAQKDGDGASLVNRIESRNGLHTLEHAEEIGLGNRAYTLVNIG